MPRKHTEIDHELLRQYIIPALRLMAQRNRHPLCPHYDGVAKPGRAKTAELAAEWLEELLAVEAEQRSMLIQIKHGRPVHSLNIPDDGDEWLAAMEREADEMHDASARARELSDPHYRCPECGIEIEAGQQIAAGVRGIVHKVCPDLVAAGVEAQQYDY
jgi:hypothetical protein